MGNNVNYAEVFGVELAQKYRRELLSGDLTTEGVNYMGGKTIRMPFLSLQGFADHSRNGGFNRRNIESDFFVKTLEHDRNVEFFVDTMDVDETNQAVAAANITNTFDTEFAIPETDAYRFSKLFQEVERLGGHIDSIDMVEDNVIDVFDNYMLLLDEAEVPVEGRLLYVTPRVMMMLKRAAGTQRFAEFNNELDRTIRMVDGVKVVVVPESRMKTAYDFTDGFVPEAGARVMDMVLIHPKTVVAFNKHSYVKLWAPGSHTVGDGYLYQNRQYGDLFVVESRVNGVCINVG